MTDNIQDINILPKCRRVCFRRACCARIRRSSTKVVIRVSLIFDMAYGPWILFNDRPLYRDSSQTDPIITKLVYLKISTISGITR